MKRAWLAMSALALSACSHGSHEGPTEPGKPAPVVEAARSDAGVAAATTATTNEGKPDPSAITPPSPPAKIKIMVRSSPPKVFVSWGKKKLGLTPLNFERPRDSGPVDLVLRASGYFPVHTRAYTVKSDLVTVKMTKLENRMTLFGAKQELPPEGAPTDPLDPANALKPTTPMSPTTPTTPSGTVPITQ